MARRRPTRRRRSRHVRRPIVRRVVLALLAIPLLYLATALIGSLIPVNRDWREPASGETVYVISNGVHTDLILPVAAQGLDWAPFLKRSDFADPDPAAHWLAFGMGERRVYLETPRWRDIRLGTILAALAGGRRVMHVEWVGDPQWHARAIRLRPEEYRRLWSAIHAGFALDPAGRPKRIAHPGYGPADAFYEGLGKANAINSCNVWAADRLRIAGVKASLWSPFAAGVVWRYRLADQST